MQDSFFLQSNQENEGKQIQSIHRNNVQARALLGKGSFSAVYEVKNITMEDQETQSSKSEDTSICALEGRFAIKHLRPDLVQSPKTFHAAAADLILEAKYLAAFDHPGIVKLHAVAHGGISAYETTGGLYDGFFLVTERLDGTLKERIQEWQVIEQLETEEDVFWEYLSPAQDDFQDDAIVGPPLGERLLLEKLDIAHQLASALEYMHAHRLINRDIKPANIGLTADNRVKLFDFGFCRELPSPVGVEGDCGELQEGQDEEEGDSDALYYMSGKGSLMYLAPEVLDPERGCYNQKVDCYSFAMVLYELLTLHKPFHISGMEEFRELLCSYKARPPLEYSGVPSQLQDLLQHAWDDNVKERWTMHKISERLQEISQQLDSTPESPTPNPVCLQSANDLMHKSTNTDATAWLTDSDSDDDSIESMATSEDELPGLTAGGDASSDSILMGNHKKQPISQFRLILPSFCGALEPLFPYAA